MDIPSMAAMAADPRVPGDECFDVNAELFQDFRSGLDYLPPDVFESFKSEMLLGKSFVGQEFGGLEVTRRRVPLKDTRNERITVLHVSELGIISPYPGQRWIEKPDQLGFMALKYLVDNVPVVNAIVNTRVRQINSFTRRYNPRGEHPVGYQICRRDGERLSDRDRAEIERIQGLLENCGEARDAADRHWIKRRDHLQTFLGKFVRATLSADACPIELVPTRSGKQITGWYLIPFDTVRLTSEEGYEGDDRIVGVQVWEERLLALYTPDRFCYEVRHPRSDMLVGGYGYSEGEMAVRIATGFLHTFNYNIAGFDRNNIPRGILTLYGNYDADQLNYFKRQWNAMLSGPAQRWRLPVMVSRDREAKADYTHIDQQFSEMHFAKWLSFLVSLFCALYGMTPEEINMDSFTSKASTLSGNDTAERLATSKDKGLEPLLQFIERVFNDWILPRLGFGRKYCLQFRGLHPRSPEVALEIRKLVQTRDELREDEGLGPYPDPQIGEAPLDPTAFMLYQQQAMQQEQQEGAGGFEEGGEEEGPMLPAEVMNRFREQPAQGAPEEEAGRADLGRAEQAVKSRPRFNLLVVGEE